VGALALRGNAYWGKFRSPDGAIAQLAAIPPDRVSVALAGSGDRAPRAHARHESIHPAVHVAPDLVGGGAPMHLGVGRLANWSQMNALPRPEAIRRAASTAPSIPPIDSVICTCAP
jgi:hypothetical protein